MHSPGKEASRNHHSDRALLIAYQLERNGKMTDRSWKFSGSGEQPNVRSE